MNKTFLDSVVIVKVYLKEHMNQVSASYEEMRQ